MIKVFLLVISLTLNISAQDADQRLKELQNEFESINDLTVDVVQKTGGKENLSGKLSYKKENKIYLEIKTNLIVSDGTSIWNYNIPKNKVIINDVDESDPSFFSFRTIVYDYTAQCNLTSEQNGEILVLSPKAGSDLIFSRAKLWLNKENLLTRILLEGTGGGDTEIIFSDYKLNQNLKDSKFVFSPPEGSTVIDLR
jgi:outer membrane lipoprotein-sorting protein